jgi:hypothetical protein
MIPTAILKIKIKREKIKLASLEICLTTLVYYKSEGGNDRKNQHLSWVKSILWRKG